MATGKSEMIPKRSLLPALRYTLAWLLPCLVVALIAYLLWRHNHLKLAGVAATMALGVTAELVGTSMRVPDVLADLRQSLSAMQTMIGLTTEGLRWRFWLTTIPGFVARLGVAAVVAFFTSFRPPRDPRNPEAGNFPRACRGAASWTLQILGTACIGVAGIVWLASAA